MVVGQRINYELAQQNFTWSPDWEAQIRAFGRLGQLFQANAQVCGSWVLVPGFVGSLDFASFHLAGLENAPPRGPGRGSCFAPCRRAGPCL